MWSALKFSAPELGIGLVRCNVPLATPDVFFALEVFGRWASLHLQGGHSPPLFAAYLPQTPPVQARLIAAAMLTMVPLFLPGELSRRDQDRVRQISMRH